VYFPISDWLPAFLATLAIEAPLIGFAFRRVADKPLAVAVVFVFANLATHLAIWFVATQLIQPGTIEFFLVAETWAIAGEALLFWAAIPGLSARRAATASAVANGASSLLGLVVQSTSGGVGPW
jgi:hypothetical protein